MRQFSLVFLGILLFVVSCGNPVKPIRKESTDNPEIAVDFLFEKDGCKIYRFLTDYRYHYFVNCSGSTSSYKYCGKSCAREEVIPTYKKE